MKIDRRNSSSALFVVVASSFLISCGGGGGGNSDPISEETARQCFDESFFRSTAATWDLTYQQFSNNTPSPVTFSKKYQIESLDGVFGQEKNLIVLSVSSSSTGLSSTATSKSNKFLQLQDNGNKKVFGLTSSGKSGTAFTNSVESYSPAYTDLTPSLKKGETGTIKITGRRESTTTISQTTTEEGPIDVTQTVRYLGNETVVTAAGKFNACHFEIDGQQEWIWRGLPIQFTEGPSGSFMQRVTSVKLNNQTVEP